MAHARTWIVRLNLDHFNAMAASVFTDADRALAMQGLGLGLNGGTLPSPCPDAFRRGWEVGAMARDATERIREQNAKIGKLGGRKPNGKPNGSPDGTPFGEPYPITNNEEQESTLSASVREAWEQFVQHLTNKFGAPSPEQLDLLMASLKSDCPDPEQAVAWIRNATENGLRRPCPPLAGRKRSIAIHDEQEVTKQRSRLLKALERERKGMASNERGSKQWTTHDAEVKRLEERLEAMTPQWQPRITEAKL